ncbi:MAG: Spy/CpxP family protein refolding chaperone [Gammaproteobacteria bacterium]
MNEKLTTHPRRRPGGVLPLALVLGAAMVVAAAHAMGPGHRGGPHHGGFGAGMAGDLFHLEHLAQRLELDDAQRAQIEQLAAASRERLKPHVRHMVEARHALRELTRADTFDEGAVRALAARSTGAMTELMVERSRQQHAVRAVLTPEQRARLDRERHPSRPAN